MSKVGARRDDKAAWLPWDRPEDLRQGIEDNLRALGVDRLRAVNLRVMDPGHGSDVPFAEQVDAMVQAREDGLIEGVGLSQRHAASSWRRRWRAPRSCACRTPTTSSTAPRQPVVDLCAERGIAFVPFFPLGSGFGVDPVLTTPSVTSTAGARCGCTPAQVALAWVLATRAARAAHPGHVRRWRTWRRTSRPAGRPRRAGARRPRLEQPGGQGGRRGRGRADSSGSRTP